jgi:hypothetical protein
MSPTFTFSGADVQKMRSPIVYVLRNAEGAPLYVGVGCRGVMRPLNPHHTSIGPIRDTDTLEFHICASAKDAIALEQTLIDALRPPRNKSRIRARGLAETRELPRGIRRSGIGWQAYIRFRGKYISKSFHINTSKQAMRRWRETTRREYKRRHATTLQAA